MPAETTGVNAMPLVLRGVRRSWGDRPVLTGADLTLGSSSVAWVGGPNGSGKTTLLRIAAGLITADDGEIALSGLDPERDPREYHRRLGWLPAGNAGIYNRLTVQQNLAYATSIALVPRRRREDAIATAMEQFDIARLRGERGDRISMGERQRLRLAMTFVHDPEVVLLDEPHTSLDEGALGRLCAALERLTARGGAAVWCSPSREGTGLPASEEYLVKDGILVPC